MMFLINNTSSNRIFLLAFLFSILFHLIILMGFPSKLYSPSSWSEQPARKVIRVTRVKPNEGQLVDVMDNQHVTDQQVDTDYLSDRNRKVDQQTRSLNITREQNQSMDSKTNEQTIEKKSKYSLNLTDQAVRNLAEQTGPTVLNQSLSSNYLPEITIGAETLLNTKEFAFNSFFIRMKREIEGFWKPAQTVGQNPSLHGTYITTLNVVLDEVGDLVQANVIKSSGFQPLDQEAIQAIERASPFPNPPKEVLGDDKKIRMKWNFIFDKSSFM